MTMVQEIAARPVTFNGRTFRSTLEARWAAFFDYLKIEWEYEPKPFFFGGVGYLPDFFVKKRNCWFEIKPNHRADLGKPELLAAAGEKIVVLIGPPGGYDVRSNALTCDLLTAPAKDVGRRLDQVFARFSACDRCGEIGLTVGARPVKCPCGGMFHGKILNARASDRGQLCSLRLMSAVGASEQPYLLELFGIN